MEDSLQNVHSYHIQQINELNCNRRLLGLTKRLLELTGSQNGHWGLTGLQNGHKGE